MKNYRWNNEKDRNLFYQSREWREMREYRLSQNPLCAKCLEINQLTPATEIDHIIPLKIDPSLRLDPNNLQCLCKKCHSEKTYNETLANTQKLEPAKKLWK